MVVSIRLAIEDTADLCICAGKSTTKVAPFSWPRLCARKVPLWASTVACEMDRPSPSPPKLPGHFLTSLRERIEDQG
jgi:hypothetical protein